MRIDLHTHSDRSDGTDTPAELTIILRHTALAGAEVGKDGPYLIIRR